MVQRALGEEMFNDFQKGGPLHELLTYVQNDDTLDLEFRGEYTANIYYRGGSLFRIDRSATGYMLTFDTKYCTACDEGMEKTPSLRAAVGLIPLYKHAMDVWFAKNRKYEREFQQVVVRENNRHGAISHATDYYIVDIEYAYNDNVSDKKTQARFDMIAVKWLSKSNERQNPSAPTLAIIEMKYGDGALGGSAGLKKHLEDFGTLVKNGELDDFCADYSNVFNQKCALGLIPGKEGARIKITQRDIELIFLIANHDPNKTGLAKIVAEIADVTMEYPYPIRFAYASMMGYCLYADPMKTLGEMQEMLKKRA